MVASSEPAVFGWNLGAVYRQHLQLNLTAVGDLPGGPRGYQVLLLAEQGTAKSQLALAQLLGVDRTAMTYLLDDLETAGLVERRPDPADRRARHIVITDRGRTRLTRTRDVTRQAEDNLLAGLAPGDRDQLRRLLAQLAASISPTRCPFQVADDIDALHHTAV